MEQEQLTLESLKQELLSLKKDVEDLKTIKEDLEFIRGTEEGWEEYDRGECVEMDGQDLFPIPITKAEA